jgi:ribosomal protein L37E
MHNCPSCGRVRFLHEVAKNVCIACGFGFVRIAAKVTEAPRKVVYTTKSQGVPKGRV